MFILNNIRFYHPGQSEVGYYGQENNNTGCDKVTKSTVLQGRPTCRQRQGTE